MNLTAFFKNSLLLILCLSILASCTKEEPIVIDEIKEITELTKDSSPMKELVAMEMDVAENSTSKTCFDIVFPVELVFADQTKQAIESFEDLTKAFRTWYEENKGKENKEPSLNYPIEVNLEDGTVKELQSDKELVALLIGCKGKDSEIKDKEACFEINYPVTLIFADKTTQVANNKEEYEVAVKDKEKGKPNFEFPIEITFQEGDVIEVKSEEDLEAIYKRCKKAYDEQEDENKDNWGEYELGLKGCFTVNYPVNLVLNDGTARSVNSEEEVFEWIKSDDFQKFTFQFPVDITLKDEETVTINSEEELVRIYEYCKEDWGEDKDEWEDKDEDHEGWGDWSDWDSWDKELELTSLLSDCFEVNYPITLILEDGYTQPINNIEEAIELFRSTDKPSFAFEFPISITIEDETKEIASLEELLEVSLKTCIDIFHDWEDDRDEEDWEHDDKEDETEWTGEIKGFITSGCFQLNYPLTLILDNGTSQVANSQDEILEYLLSFYRQPFTLQYPINITLENEERKEVNSQEELTEIYYACFEGFGEWEDDDREDWFDFDWDEFDFDEDQVEFSFLKDCFKVNYPRGV